MSAANEGAKDQSARRAVLLPGTPRCPACESDLPVTSRPRTHTQATRTLQGDLRALVGKVSRSMQKLLDLFVKKQELHVHGDIHAEIRFCGWPGDE